MLILQKHFAIWWGPTSSRYPRGLLGGRPSARGVGPRLSSGAGEGRNAHRHPDPGRDDHRLGLLSWLLGRKMKILSMGDEEARTLGVSSEVSYAREGGGERRSGDFHRDSTRRTWPAAARNCESWPPPRKGGCAGDPTAGRDHGAGLPPSR